jgi:UPF0755 protein
MRLLRWLLALLIAGGVVAGAAYYLWTVRPLTQAPDGVEFEIKAGDSARAVAREIAQAGVALHPTVFVIAARATDTARMFRPGFYRIDPGMTLSRLIDRLARADMLRTDVRFIEGWTFRQMRALLETHPGLRKGATGLDDRQIMQTIGASEELPEGLFFPATYVVPKGTSDLAVLKLAYQTMREHLAAAWQGRDPGSPLRSAYEALILASIVEKESGSEGDRVMVAAVFSNRLRIGMKLQADPTVIYGVGERFDGNLRRNDLTSDTPYNTYTRIGLPPTPIAMPGDSALVAATRPPPSDALYFVARGDGSSEFSHTLEAHNRAVAKYQRGRAD